MSAGAALARAAAALAGCRFRLHGRDPATGLDCVGLVGAALAAIGRPIAVPSGYDLRTGAWPGLAAFAADHGFVTAGGKPRAGDVWLLRPGPGQLHLAVVGPDGATLVEAHAGLRRIVITPLHPALRVMARWRLGADIERS